jgi:hypothetical protein
MSGEIALKVGAAGQGPTYVEDPEVALVKVRPQPARRHQRSCGYGHGIIMARERHRGEEHVIDRNRTSSSHRGAATGLYRAQVAIADGQLPPAISLVEP